MRAIRVVLVRVAVITRRFCRSSTSTLHSATQSSVVNLKAPKQSAGARATVDIAGKGHVLQDVMDEVLAQGAWITRASRLRGQELVEVRQSIRLPVTAALSLKDCERVAGIIKAAVTKVLA